MLVQRFRSFDLACVLTAVAALAIHEIADGDLWWQLATAKQIWASGLPELDPYSYAFPNRAWIELRWLYYLGAWAIAEPFGLNALIVAKAICLLITFGLLARACAVEAPGITSFALSCALALAHTRFGVRPELMSFLWLAAMLLCLDRFKRGGGASWLAALLPIQVLWNNTHTLGILGPLLALSLAASEWLQSILGARVPLLAGDPNPIRGRRLAQLAVAGLALLVAGLATPYGVAGALYPLTLFGMISASSPLSRMIAELHSPLFHPGWHLSFAGWIALAALSGASFWIRPQAFVLARLVWWMGFLHIATLSLRNVALFGFVASAILAGNLRDALAARREEAEPRALRALSAATALTSLVLVFAAVTDRFPHWQHSDTRFGFGIAERRFPVRALSFAIERGLPLPPIGDLGSGGYFLYRLGPRSTLIDGRLEVYGEKILVDAVLALENPTRFEALARRHHVDTAILDLTTLPQTIAGLARSPNWSPVYYDSGFVVFVRRHPGTSDLLGELALDFARDPTPEISVPAFDSPPDWLAGVFPRVPDPADTKQLAFLFLLVGADERALRSYAQALALAPDDAEIHAHLAVLEHALGKPESAQARLAALDPEILARAEFWELRAQLAERHGAIRESYDFLERALRCEEGDTLQRRRLLGELAARLGLEAEASRWRRSLGAQPALEPAQ
jgi:hypothetical protein